MCKGEVNCLHTARTAVPKCEGVKLMDVLSSMGDILIGMSVCFLIWLIKSLGKNSDYNKGFKEGYEIGYEIGKAETGSEIIQSTKRREDG